MYPEELPKYTLPNNTILNRFHEITTSEIKIDNDKKKVARNSDSNTNENNSKSISRLKLVI